MRSERQRSARSNQSESTISLESYAYAPRRYFALAACSALFKYLELKLHIAFPVASVRMRYVALEGQKGSIQASLLADA